LGNEFAESGNSGGVCDSMAAVSLIIAFCIAKFSAVAAFDSSDFFFFLWY
jgi:hypothetical protein